MQCGQLKRRTFITLIGEAVAWPLAARTQDGRTYRIGVLNANPRGSPLVTALFDELRRNGRSRAATWSRKEAA